MDFLFDMIASDMECLAANAADVDALIIGSGTAGVTTAIALAEQGINVAILESGPLISLTHLANTPFVAQQELTAQIHQHIRHPCQWVNKKEQRYTQNNNSWQVVGGRTLFWNGLIPRFQEYDFAQWPCHLQELVAYYEKSEKLLAEKEVQSDQQSGFFQSYRQNQLIQWLQQAGVVANPAPVAIDRRPIKNGVLSHGVDSSISRLVRSGLLIKIDSKKQGIGLIPNARVDRIYVQAGRVTSLEVKSLCDNKSYKIAAKYVILACGAMASTRLVMASQLPVNQDIVGRYIHDHLFVRSVLKVQDAVENQEPVFIHLPATRSKDYQFHFRGPHHYRKYNTKESVQWLQYQPKGQYIEAYSFGVGESRYDNHLRLKSETYEIVYDYSEKDQQRIQEMCQEMQRLSHIMHAELCETMVYDPGQSLHEAGGLRMSDHPTTGVVDAHGCFWQIANLAAVDASIWPTQGAANPYLTITACALRCADHLTKVIRRQACSAL